MCSAKGKRNFKATSGQGQRQGQRLTAAAAAVQWRRYFNAGDLTAWKGAWPVYLTRHYIWLLPPLAGRVRVWGWWVEAPQRNDCGREGTTAKRGSNSKAGQGATEMVNVHCTRTWD